MVIDIPADWRRRNGKVNTTNMSDSIRDKPVSTLSRNGTHVLERFIDALDWYQATRTILEWANHHKHKYVCLCNVHSAVTALDDPSLSRALSQADMVLPDGAPIAWVMRRKGFPKQTRIAGPDLMWRLCNQAQNSGTSIFLFGSKPETLYRLENNLQEAFPRLKIAGSLSPRFGEWSPDEERNYITAINDSGAGLIFVGLGCPRQEIWMADNRERIRGVLLGVGAAFDFHAGTVQRAPKIFQALGLEWLHRLLSEPKRLWRRYLYSNSKFIYYLVTKEFVGGTN